MNRRCTVVFLMVMLIIGCVGAYQDGVQQVGPCARMYIPTARELKDYGAECFDIIKALFKDQKHTAAVTASSPWVVYHITKYIALDKPLHILEAGSGSGTVTKKIIERMHSASQLDAVEYNSDLYGELVHVLGDKQNERIKFHHAAIETWQPDHSVKHYYDVIISTLPITQLPLQTMQQILQRYATMLKPGGLLIYITLCGARTLTLWAKTIKLHVAKAIDSVIAIDQQTLDNYTQELEGYRSILHSLHEWEMLHFIPVKTEIVPLNITPIYVMCLQKK